MENVDDCRVFNDKASRPSLFNADATKVDAYLNWLVLVDHVSHGGNLWLVLSQFFDSGHAVVLTAWLCAFSFH